MFPTWLISVSCLLAVAQDGPIEESGVPAKIERFLERCESARRGAIAQIEHTIRGLRRQSPATRETNQRLTRLEEQLGALRSGRQPVVPQIAFPPQSGAIGRLPKLSCHVDQVVSHDELLVRCFFPVVVTTVRQFQARRETVVPEVRFLIRGLPTENVDEGSDLQLPQVFEVIGNETYRFVDGGSKRLYVLREFDMELVEPYFRKMAGRNQ